MQKALSDIYKKEIIVQSEHLDAIKHVNNAVYVQWIQEIAGEHWHSKFAKKEVPEDFWVVLEHHIQYKKQAFLGELLRVETYVEEPNGLRWPRVVNFYREDTLIVTARTSWCWIDAQSQRPKRISPEVLATFLTKS